MCYNLTPLSTFVDTVHTRHCNFIDSRGLEASVVINRGGGLLEIVRYVILKPLLITDILLIN